MSSNSERVQGRRRERDARRAAIGSAYKDLARREAERTAFLDDALAAAAARREALAAVAEAEKCLAMAVCGLCRAGMTLADAAATVQLDTDALGRVMTKADPTTDASDRSPAAADRERDVASPMLP